MRSLVWSRQSRAQIDALRARCQGVDTIVASIEFGLSSDPQRWAPKGSQFGVMRTNKFLEIPVLEVAFRIDTKSVEIIALRELVE